VDRLIASWQQWSAPASAAVSQGAQAMDLPTLLALAAALGWASGLRLYAVLFMAGFSGFMGWIVLPSGLHLLQHPIMLAASGGMLFVEFFADKIPGLDSLWDIVHSVIRVPGGAALAAAVFGADNTTMAVVAGLLGGSLAAASYAGKVTTRAAVNTSPEPFSNIAVSLLEDGLVVGAMWLATQHPVLFAIALAITLVLTLLLIVLLFRFLRAIGRRIGDWFDPSPAH
jgi:Domain of unknown function (DUF4126)